MGVKTLTDSQVFSYFSRLSSDGVLSHLKALQHGLQRYSENPGIVPPRTKAFTPRGDTLHMFMPVVDDLYCGVKTLGYNEKSGLGFVGTITVLDPVTGLAQGVVDSKQVTGIRTALSSHIGLYECRHKFADVKSLSVTVFGSGLQAFWHSVICAKLFPDKQVDLNVVYRSNPINQKDLLEACDNYSKINLIKSDSSEVSAACNRSHIIFGTIPSSNPSILKKFFDDESSGVPFTYIGLIGSYQPHMHECDSELVNLFQQQGARIIVDSTEHTLLEAGELIDAQVAPSQLIEIGHLKSDSSQRIEATLGSRSITLSKIVGLAIMDIVTARKTLDSF